MRYCIRDPRLRFCGREEFTELVRGVFLAVIVASSHIVFANHKALTAGGAEITESGGSTFARTEKSRAILRPRSRETIDCRPAETDENYESETKGNGSESFSHSDSIASDKQNAIHQVPLAVSVLGMIFL